MNPSEQTPEEELDLVPDPVASPFRAESLTPGDVLKLVGDEPKAYVVRLVWLKFHCLEKETFLRSKVTGFTLLATWTLTDREATIDEMQKALDDGVLMIHKPPVERAVVGLTPKDYHKTK